MSATGTMAAQPRRVADPSGTLAGTIVLLFIASMPFSITVLLATPLFEISGLRVVNMLYASAFLAFLASGVSIFKSRDRLERAAMIAFAVYIAVFAVAFARSIPNVGRFAALEPESFQNAGAYPVHFFLRTLMAMQFVYVLKMFRTPEALQRLFTAIGASLFVLSIVVIVAVFADPSVLNTPDRSGITKLTEAVLGMHYNDASAPYIIAAPMLTYMALTRGGFWTINTLLAFVAVVCLESRTTLFLFAGISVLTAIMMGRARVLVAVAPTLALAGFLIVGPILIDIVSKGFTQQSGFSLYYFLSGRDEAIWLPLAFEWSLDPVRFWFGSGEYGILTSNFLVTGKMLEVAQAHNIFLEFFLDDGIVLLGVFVVALIVFVRWAVKTGYKVKSQVYWMLFFCFVSFLISGITGRRAFPHEENILMLPMLAAMINVARLKLAEKGLLHPRRKKKPMNPIRHVTAVPAA